jgi:thiol-disulfide isomerase/thioredoxin
MKLSILLLLLFFIDDPVSGDQNIEVIDVETLEKIIHEPTKTTRVINFWATWCKPCIEELPYFEALRKDPAFDQVEVILISLDFISDLDTRVRSFVSKKDIQSTVMLLDNTDYNSWIDKVDSSWSGAIPATLIINGKTRERKFIEKQFEEGELKNVLSDFINQ